jgi:hypothetical protein
MGILMSIPTDPPARRKIDPRQVVVRTVLMRIATSSPGVFQLWESITPLQRGRRASARPDFAADAASRVRRRVNVWRRQVRSLIHPAEFASIEPVRS